MPLGGGHGSGQGGDQDHVTGGAFVWQPQLVTICCRRRERGKRPAGFTS